MIIIVRFFSFTIGLTLLIFSECLFSEITIINSNINKWHSVSGFVPNEQNDANININIWNSTPYKINKFYEKKLNNSHKTVLISSKELNLYKFKLDLYKTDLIIYADKLIINGCNIINLTNTNTWYANNYPLIYPLDDYRITTLGLMSNRSYLGNCINSANDHIYNANILKNKEIYKKIKNVGESNADKDRRAKVGIDGERGGQIILLVKKLECGDHSNLHIETSAGNYDSARKKRAIFNNISLSRPPFNEYIDDAVEKNLPGKISIVVEDYSSINCITGRSLNLDFEYNIPFNNLNDFNEIFEKYPLAKDIFLYNLLNKLEIILSKAILASTNKDIYYLAVILQEYSALMKKGYPISSNDLNKRVRLKLDILNKIRDNLSDTLIIKSFHFPKIDNPYFNVEVVYNTRTLKAKVVPNVLSIIPREIEGKEYLGVIEFDPLDKDIIKVWFDIELSVDPYSQSLLKEEIDDSNWNLDGQFQSWILGKSNLSSNIVGLKNYEIQPNSDGRSLSLLLELDKNISNVFLNKLSSPQGINLSFNWKYKNDQSIIAEWGNIPLSLTKRKLSRVFFDESKITNNGSDSIIINYLKLKKGFMELNPTIQIAPGDSYNFPESIDKKNPISGTAINYSSNLNSNNLDNKFYLLNKDVIIKKLTVRNLLRSENEDGIIYSVNLIVKYKSPNRKPVIRKISLNSVGSNNNSATLTFFGVENIGTYTVSGSVEYEGGGYSEIIEYETSNNTINIDKKMLKGNL